MIKIVTKSDLDGLEKLNLPEVMKRYLRDYHGEMLKRLDEYECNGANERSALAQFDKCVSDGKGYVIVLEENGGSGFSSRAKYPNSVC